MKIIVTSRGAADRVTRVAARCGGQIMGGASVCVPADQEESYKAAGVPLLLHPGLDGGELRQWILDNVTDRTVVIVPDTFSGFDSLVGFQSRRFDSSGDVTALIERCAIAANDAGAKVFGFRSKGSPSQHSRADPFAFTQAPSKVIGIIGRDIRFDPRFNLLADCDAALQSLKQHRVVWIDQRFKPTFLKTPPTVTEDEFEDEIQILKEKWQRFVEVKRTKSGTRIEIKVKR